MTNQDLLLMILTDARAIQAELACEPSDTDFAAWMKTELAGRLKQRGFTVKLDAPFSGLEASSAEPPEIYAIGLVTETSETPVTQLLDESVAELAKLPAGYTARWVAGVTWSDGERTLIEEYAVTPANQAICGETDTGLGAIVVTVPG